MDSTAAKSLSALEWLCRRESSSGVTEMAIALGLSKSNAHRILNTLTSLGYAKSDEIGRYSATLKAWEIGSWVLARLDVKELARPKMAELSRRTGETVHLSMLDGFEVVYIDKVDSNQPVRAYSRVGGRAPAHAVATGKALLAFSIGDAEALLPDDLQSFTEHTISQRSRFAKELEAIRNSGYAINRGEWREDVCGIGAPIRNDRRQVVAAIGISGPSSRLTASQLEALAPSVVESANEVALDLGYRPPGSLPATSHVRSEV